MSKGQEASQIADQAFDFSEVGRSLDRLYLTHRRSLEGIHFGEVIAPNLGNGLEVDGVRPYVYGDDSRHIDHKVSERMGELYTRQFQAEISPSLWLVTDTAETKYQASTGQHSKQEIALSALMLFAKLAERDSMPVGLIVAHDRGLYADREPLSGSGLARRVGQKVNELLQQSSAVSDEAKPPYLADVLRVANSKASRDAVVILSGFRDSVLPKEGKHAWLPGILRLLSHENDLTTVRVEQRRNDLSNKVDSYWLGGKRYVNIAGKFEAKIRKKVTELAGVQDQAILEALQRRYVGSMELSTDVTDWFSGFRLFLKRRASLRSER